MKLPDGKRAGSLAISIAVHTVVIFILGGLIWIGPPEKKKILSGSVMDDVLETSLLEEEISEPLVESPVEATPDETGDQATMAGKSSFPFVSDIVVTDLGLLPLPSSSFSPQGTTVGGLFGGGSGAGRGVNGPVGGGGGARALVRGLSIEARKLGVVLDISGSMHPFIEDTVRQIRRQFPQYELILVEGCCVGWFAKSPEQWERIQIRKGGNPVFEELAEKYLPDDGYAFIEKAGTANVLAAMRYLVEEKNCDAVYFFSDFRDMVNEEGVDRLEKILQGKRLYLDSINGSPSQELVRLVRKSGGTVRVGEKAENLKR